MLRITKLTDYATLVLTVLAARPEAVLSAADLAERAGLEGPTVSKLLKPLAQAGLVEGFRGVRGGYRLARAAADISLVEIVEAMEGPLAMTECSLDHGECGLSQRCGVRANWRRINDVVAEALRNVSLAHMLEDAPLPTPATKRIPARLAGAHGGA
ncbi:MAG: SUF system Fe-S cluster assembly regulator [Proteobacteria bacterium]|nr:SUF system Fe-S cluster assembly regulator [Pseudomonadota bacterium]